jgi:hypothetical protein
MTSTQLKLIKKAIDGWFVPTMPDLNLKKFDFKIPHSKRFGGLNHVIWMDLE